MERSESGRLAISISKSLCSTDVWILLWTGDDWHSQQNRIVSPKYGCLPNFRGPDLPSPRTPLEDTGPHTRKSEDKSAPSYLPVEVEDTASDLSKGRPRIRCAICAWNLERKTPFDRTLPEPDKRPDKPPTPNQFATMMRSLIQEGRVTRRQLGDALVGNNRWRNLDRWLDTGQEGKKKVLCSTSRTVCQTVVCCW